jgi:hypothetical protein
MRYLTIYLCLLLTFTKTLFANEILKCLGKEETLLHQNKVQGPIYQLNQNLIGLFSTNSELNLDSNILQESCRANKSKLGTSVILLKNLAIGRDKIFIAETGAKGSLAKNDVIQAIPGLLFDYFSGLQGLAQDPHCLDTGIPKLLALKTKIKYLESESNARTLLFQETANIVAIFNQIENLDAIYAKCKISAEKKNKKVEPTSPTPAVK